MERRKKIKRFIFISLGGFIICYISFKILNPVFISNNVIVNLGFKILDITQYTKEWYYLKLTYMISFIFSSIIYLNFFYSKLFKIFFKNKTKKEKYIIKSDKINLLIGNDEKTGKNVYVKESRVVSKFLNNRNYWYRKDKFCDVSVYRTNIKI